MNKQLIKAYEKETHTSFRDSLTGLFNHGIFQILLDEAINRAQRYGDLFTLAIIDIDSFSFYHKHHTPVLGDQMLKNLAKLIKENLREPDIASRYSGDVFAVLLPKASARDAYIALERIRNSVQTQTQGSLTVSAGIACCPIDASNKGTLILKAQDALLKAKVSGKNKVYFLEEGYRSSDKETSKILIVDDDHTNVKLMDAVLSPLHHEIFKAYSGEEALSIIQRVDIDLILLDVMMPNMDGYEVCRRLKQREETRMIPIVMVTALDETEARVKGIEAGAEDFISKPPNRIELVARINSLLNVNRLNKKLISVETVLISMANAVEAKDVYTQGHIQRVADMAVALGKKMDLSPREIDSLRLGGILHDVGKIGVSREILNKPGSLDPDEWEIIKGHPDAAYKICLPLEKTLGPALEAIRHHHEKLDGSGYPDGIKGDEVSVLARIIAVVDIFDALDTDRPYRKRMPREKTIQILCQEAEEGKLDKNIVEHLLQLLGPI